MLTDIPIFKELISNNVSRHLNYNSELKAEMELQKRTLSSKCRPLQAKLWSNCWKSNQPKETVGVIVQGHCADKSQIGYRSQIS